VLINGVRHLRDTFVASLWNEDCEAVSIECTPFDGVTFISDGKSTHLAIYRDDVRTLIHGHDASVDRGRVSYPDQVRRQEPSSEAIDS
jgi:hypothetical protein